MTETGTQTAGRMPWRQTVQIDRLLISGYNPRVDLGDLQDLEASIRAVGLQEPILVIPAPDKGDEKTTYYYIEDGERRYHAMRGWCTEIPAIIRPLRPGETVQERVLTTSVVTGIQRKTLNPIERAKAFEKLMKQFDLKQPEIARMVGVSVSTVSNALALLNFSDKDQGKIARGDLKVTDAMKIIARQRAKDRRKRGGSGQMGAQWEPLWFTSTHALAKKAVALCNKREHNNRRRIGATSGFAGACGQCWESVIRADQDLVNEAAQ